MKRWAKEEIEYLQNNYANTLDKNLSIRLNRSLKSISYVAGKYNLKKTKEFYENSRKKTSILFIQKELEKKYLAEKRSIREISKEMRVSKSTVDYYLKKFNIKKRVHKEAVLINPQKCAWSKGLTKKDYRILKISKGVRRAFSKKRIHKIRLLELKYGKSLKEIINSLYWDKNYSQDEIAKILDFDRSIIIRLMKRFNIPKRPKYQFISDLRGQNHSLFGKSWESLLGKKDSDKRKKESAKRFRELTIRRLKNKEFPFFDTKIEIIMAKALLNVGISFVKQFNMDNRFVCDFAIPHLKIVIECDGDYWHANPQIYKNKQLTFRQEKNIRRDRCKDQYIKGQGWKIIRFYESEILNSLEKCIRDVKEAISSEELKKIKSPIEDLMK